MHQNSFKQTINTRALVILLTEILPVVKINDGSDYIIFEQDFRCYAFLPLHLNVRPHTTEVAWQQLRFALLANEPLVCIIIIATATAVIYGSTNVILGNAIAEQRWAKQALPGNENGKFR